MRDYCMCVKFWGKSQMRKFAFGRKWRWSVVPQRLKKTPSGRVKQMDSLPGDHQYSVLSLFLFVLDHWWMEVRRSDCSVLSLGLAHFSRSRTYQHCENVLAGFFLRQLINQGTTTLRASSHATDEAAAEGWVEELSSIWPAYGPSGNISPSRLKATNSSNQTKPATWTLVDIEQLICMIRPCAFVGMIWSCLPKDWSHNEKRMIWKGKVDPCK